MAAKRMAEGGRIINLSSSTTAMMLPGYAAYVATKGAVEQFSHVLAKEFGPKKITVNVVSPGPTDTELFSQGKSEEQKQRFASRPVKYIPPMGGRCQGARCGGDGFRGGT
jgi:3-oxoacyl-[acyl-carrier protein] reductase